MADKIIKQYADRPSQVRIRDGAALADLVMSVRQSLAENSFTSNAVMDAVRRLKEFGYKGYDDDKFPALKNTAHFEDTSESSPSNLAEALLWKLGKWKVYKSFIDNYKSDKKAVTRRGGIVLSAFAKHLNDQDKPIYDQHAIRALWAIYYDLCDDEKDKCKALLFDRNGKWKPTGSGDYNGECYELFVRRVEDICRVNLIKKGELDRLLMPLGQAIKKSTKSKEGDYEKFCKLCGWDI